MTGRWPSQTRTAGLAAALVGLIVLTGCTSSGPGSSRPGSSSTTSANGSSPAPAPSTTVPSTSPAGSHSRARPTSSTPPKPLTPQLPACTGSQLRVAALRGSAAAGEEFAVLTFTNIGRDTCTMFGFPGVSLRLNDKLVGQPARRTGKTPSTVTLKPGARAHANVTDFSSCQAPVSETVRIYPPNHRTFVDRPLALRACHVVVDPVTHS